MATYFSLAVIIDTISCTGGSRSQIEHCCDSKNPCDINQGDCDNDNHCRGDLVCGKNNCMSSFIWRFADCCMVRRKSKYLLLFKQK